MGNPFEDLRQAVVVRPMNSPGPQGAAAPEMKIQYSNDGLSWHDDPVDTDRYLRFSTDNGVSWSNAIYFNNLAETLEWVEKARQWAINPENEPIEDMQYSALHHALQAKKSEITAGEYAIDAAGSATEAFGAAAPAWDSETVYSYNDVVSFDNGHTYRCIGTDIVGVDHAPNINGVDNEAEWTRITVVPDGYFEVDENGDLMPMLTPITSEIFMLDGNGDIMYQDPIDLEPWGGIEFYGKMEFVDSIADLRNTSFYDTTEYVYVVGYYGAGTPGGGMFYKDIESSESDNGGTIIIDSDGIRWKRANVHEEYYASWFGVSIDIDDNSPLIQNAIDAMSNENTLIFGPGTYKCEQTINIFKGISIQGSSKAPAYRLGNRTILKYTGPNPSNLTPFIDFRGNSGTSRYTNTIRYIMFDGIGQDSNIVGLWFYECVGSLLEHVVSRNFKHGIQIDYQYYYGKFNDVTCVYCDYAFRAEHIGNGAVFNYCNFRNSNVGFACNLQNKWDTGIYLNNCYFEANKTAIIAGILSSIHIDKCYFEGNSEYILEVLCPSAGFNPLVVFNNTYIHLSGSDLTSNKAVIKQNVHSDNIVSYDIRNNSIRNRSGWDTPPIIIDFDYFIYVISGGVIIKAENNKLLIPSGAFPICSTTPSESSYFNNDFS